MHRALPVLEKTGMDLFRVYLAGSLDRSFYRGLGPAGLPDFY